MDRKFARPKKVVFCNNKGGVGKSTLAFNIAVGCAALGYKTVLVDLDPQCNLSLLALGNDFYQDDEHPPTHTIYSILKAKIDGSGEIDLSIKPIKIRENLAIVPGDVNLALYEDIISEGVTNAMAGRPRGYSDTSAIDRYLNEIGSSELVDIFIIDTSPSLGALNRVILLGCEYFIVPLIPDAFSVQGIENLGNVFARWKREWRDTARSSAVSGKIALNQVLGGEGLFLGYIVNNFNVYNKETVSRQRDWLQKIPGRVREYLSEKHGRNGLVSKSSEAPLGEIQDAGQLAAICHTKKTAFSELTPKIAQELNLTGTKQLHEKIVQNMNSLVLNIIQLLDKY
ncbi:MAG: AAA family ATPase [Alphaproteobacteria bacterium]|nr:AAA family ATPase [Alphaproteobacteria bacterium]